MHFKPTESWNSKISSLTNSKVETLGAFIRISRDKSPRKFSFEPTVVSNRLKNIIYRSCNGLEEVSSLKKKVTGSKSNIK